jgi:hypothetical protein
MLDFFESRSSTKRGLIADHLTATRSLKREPQRPCNKSGPAGAARRVRKSRPPNVANRRLSLKSRKCLYFYALEKRRRV